LLVEQLIRLRRAVLFILVEQLIRLWRAVLRPGTDALLRLSRESGNPSFNWRFSLLVEQLSSLRSGRCLCWSNSLSAFGGPFSDPEQALCFVFPAKAGIHP